MKRNKRQFKILFFALLWGGFLFFSGSASAATNVYYSVGQNTTSHETGSGTVTVAGTTATFSVAQTAANMGVGDIIDYDTDNKKCYISAKASTTVWNCVSATGGTPTAATDATVNSVSHAFSSINAARNGADNLLGTSDLVAGDFILNLPCYYDSGAGSGDGLSGYTTGSSNYIRLYAPDNTSTEVNVSQRHAGRWDSTKFRVENTNGSVLTIAQSYTRVEGLQIKITENDGGDYENAIGVQASPVYVSHSLIQLEIGNGSDGIRGIHNGVSSHTLYAWNNIIYGNRTDLGTGIMNGATGAMTYAFNNTFYNLGFGFNHSAGNSPILKNNISYGNGDNYGGTFDASSTNNLSGPGTDAQIPATNKQDGVAVNFLDAANGNLLLAPTDTGAKENGINLSADANLPFSNDSEGEVRPQGSNWDIGADEYRLKNVYYSVGQSAADLKTGSPTITLVSGVATFSEAQTGNIGVGDRITYNGSSKAYISGKSSQTVWTVVTSQGMVPPDITAQTVDSIKHEYTALSAAEAGATDANHLNTSDLVFGNYQLNFPCYYDSGADTTAVAINGYTTGANNYIKIYTPNNTNTEVNQSQRHSGKWNNAKYRLETTNTTSMYNYEDYVRIDGLQIKITANNEYHGYRSDAAIVGEEFVSNCIVWGVLSTGTWQAGIKSYGTTGHTVKVWNNIVYDFNRADCAGIWVRATYSYLYNNTVIDCTYGLKDQTLGTTIAKNNLVKGSGSNSAYGGAYAAGTDYNATDVTDNIGAGTHNRISQTFSFLDEANDDFHLAPSDNGARTRGTDLSADASLPITTDIDGENRGAVWNIGADETTDQVFYSVGQNATDHSSGGNVSITDGLATFSVAQTATNLGVGDKLTAGGNAYYLVSKNSTTSWNVATKLGAIPADLASTTVNSIAHEYTSLSDAEAGASDGNHLDTSDLVSGNYVLNLPCYYDTGADTTAVEINGWTTGANNYIKVYTPNNTSTEVNQSQRHSGKWDDGKYRLVTDNAPLVINEAYTKIFGIQIGRDLVISGNTSSLTLQSGGNYFTLAYSIFRGIDAYSIDNNTFIYIGTAGNSAYIYNNIIYDCARGIRDDSPPPGAYLYTYNNTFYNIKTIALFSWPGFTRWVAINNITENAGATGDGFYGGFNAASDYNISDIASDAPGANSKNSTTVTFLDETNDDFHLSSLDTAAEQSGADLSADANIPFSTDIDGENRFAPWEIGADEIALNSESQSSDQKKNSLTDGLILYHSFDGADISGTTALDRSGSGNNGTISGASVTPGKRGQALIFDGTDDKITTALHIPDSGYFSVSMWIKKNTNGTGARILFAQDSDGVGAEGGSDISLHYNPVANAFSYKNENNISDIQGGWLYTLDDNWHYLTLVESYTGDVDDASLYVDGTPIADLYAGQNIYVSNTSIYFGGRENSELAWSGYFDEVRVYNRELSSSEAGDLYRLGQEKINMSLTDKNTDGLVGMWSFDGPNMDWSQASAEARDTSGNANHGDVSGTTATPGKIGQALSFNGSTSYINSGSAASLDNIETQGGGGMTVSAWINALSYGESNNGNILSKGSMNMSGSWRFMFAGAANYVFFQKDYDGANDLSVMVNYPDTYFNTWKHLVVTWDGSASSSNAHIYIDGSEASKAASFNGEGNKISDNLNFLAIGAADNYGSGELSFNGKIDETRVYNRVLSATEIADLYRLGQAKIRN